MESWILHHKTRKENRSSTFFRWEATYSRQTCQWVQTSVRVTRRITPKQRSKRIAELSYYRNQKKRTCRSFRMMRSQAQIFIRGLCIIVQPRKAYWWNSATTSPQSRTWWEDPLLRICPHSVLEKSIEAAVWHQMFRLRDLSCNRNRYL